MPKPFHFKKFTIHHTLNAMKVSTDACVFGSLIADILSTKKEMLHAADIGAGTGLLSCMVQQKNLHLSIDAIEIENTFCQEMETNVSTCEFPHRITILNQPLQQYIPPQQYDIIFSNPPFFTHQMPSQNLQRRQARHTISLTPDDIFLFTKNYLKPKGFLFLLLPYTDVQYWIQASQQIGLFIHQKINIKTQIQKPYSRLILGFSFLPFPTSEEELVYSDDNNNSQHKFKTLLKDYYLFI